MMTPSHPPFIFEVHNLTKQYDQAVVLNVSELSCLAGKMYCVYGPNGSGKTTLFEILTLLKKPTQGRVVFQGEEIFPAEHGRERVRSEVTLVHQNPLLFDTTVEKNVDYGLRIRRMEKALRRKRVEECLQLVGLSGFQKRKALGLSGGEIQRVAIARALAIRPTVLFLDEFSANIDEKHRKELETIIRRINAEYGTTILFTTHYLDQAFRLADEVMHLFNGRIVNSPLQNVFHGVIRLNNAEHRFYSEYMDFEVVTRHEGPATVAISPDSLVLSVHPLESSMRNCLPGKISHIIDAGTHVNLRIMAADTFEATITKASYHSMGLHPGMPVYVNFKASSVEVF